MRASLAYHQIFLSGEPQQCGSAAPAEHENLDMVLEAHFRGGDLGPYRVPSLSAAR